MHQLLEHSHSAQISLQYIDEAVVGIGKIRGELAQVRPLNLKDQRLSSYKFHLTSPIPGKIVL